VNILIPAIIGGVANALGTYLDHGNGAQIAASFLTGALLGAATGSGIPIASNPAVAGFLAGFADYLVQTLSQYPKKDCKVNIGSIIGAALGAYGGGMGAKYLSKLPFSFSEFQKAFVESLPTLGKSILGPLGAALGR